MKLEVVTKEESKRNRVIHFCEPLPRRTESQIQGLEAKMAVEIAPWKVAGDANERVLIEMLKLMAF